jgi:hypothetical protein
VLLTTVTVTVTVTVMQVNTANAAKAFGVRGGQVWPYIALGTGFRRCLSSMPSDASRSPPVPSAECPNSEYIMPGEGMWDYACVASLLSD